MTEFKANKEKELEIESDGSVYYRIPIKTHVIKLEDKAVEVLNEYVKPIIEEGDVVFIAESVVATMQQRAIKLTDIKPRPLATLMSKFVYKNPYGIGLAMPETMEMAFREVGTMRIMFASAVSVVGKLFGKRGWFYEIAGPKAREIDGPCDYTLPPYNEYVVLGPEEPQKTAEQIAKDFGYDIAIVDINDLGGNILGNTSNYSDEQLADILRDNPLGQSDEQTPMGIIREK